MVVNWAFKHLKTVSILGVLCLAGPSVLAESIVTEGKSGRIPYESDVAQPKNDDYRSFNDSQRPYREITEPVAVPVERPVRHTQQQAQTSKSCGNLSGDLCRMFQLTNKERLSAGLPAGSTLTTSLQMAKTCKNVIPGVGR